MRVVEEGYDQSVLNNSLSVRPVVDLAIGLLATSHSDIQGVRITKSFSPGDEATNNLGLEEMGVVLCAFTPGRRGSFGEVLIAQISLMFLQRREVVLVYSCTGGKETKILNTA